MIKDAKSVLAICDATCARNFVTLELYSEIKKIDNIILSRLEKSDDIIKYYNKVFREEYSFSWSMEDQIGEFRSDNQIFEHKKWNWRTLKSLSNWVEIKCNQLLWMFNYHILNFGKNQNLMQMIDHIIISTQEKRQFKYLLILLTLLAGIRKW